MSANTPTPTGGEKADERVFVKIPKAGPGQGYQAPRNFQNPFMTFIWKAATVLMCLSLPLVPGIIIVLIVFLPPSDGYQNAFQEGLLWLWIPMILFVEAIAIFAAYNIAREALGYSGATDYER